jgi:hypothetical protein
MNLDLSVIGNEAELAKLVHEKADTGACRADHLRQRFLADSAAMGCGVPSSPKFARRRRRRASRFSLELNN